MPTVTGVSKFCLIAWLKRPLRLARTHSSTPLTEGLMISPRYPTERQARGSPNSDARRLASHEIPAAGSYQNPSRDASWSRHHASPRLLAPANTRARCSPEYRHQIFIAEHGAWAGAARSAARGPTQLARQAMQAPGRRKAQVRGDGARRQGRRRDRPPLGALAHDADRPLAAGHSCGASGRRPRFEPRVGMLARLRGRDFFAHWAARER